MKFLIIVFLLLPMIPAFADPIQCQGQVSQNGTVITCPNVPTQQSQQSSSFLGFQLPSGQDIVNTIFNKLSGSLSQDSGVQNITSNTQQTVDDSLKVFGDVKNLVGAILGYASVKFYGQPLPPYVIPIMTIVMVGAIVLAIFRHAWKIFLIGIILGILLLVVLSGSTVVFPQ